MVKEKKIKAQKEESHYGRWPSFFILIIYFFFGGLIGLSIILIAGAYFFETNYQQKIYPGIRIDRIPFDGRTPQEVENYFNQKSTPFSQLNLTFKFEDKTATLSGKELKIAFDGKLSAIQAYSIGRSGHIFSDIYNKWFAATTGVNLSSVLNVDNNILDEVVNNFAVNIDIAPKDALFQFENGKVVLFRLSQPGRRLNKEQTKKLVYSYITALGRQESITPKEITIDLSIETVHPQITTENSNNLGIKQLLGTGNSKFAGSIPGRIHNIELAASKINGHLVAPEAIFSFNKTLGDVSITTGFQPAYIIKDGRTVLGDGGGVCQVSTTLFRAAINAGLKIVERHPHSYRVSYYEQDSPPGMDATVFDPNYDLKFNNDTTDYILIQARTDKANYFLTFEIYGTSDGRKAEITKPVILSQTSPPPDLYQDDPTLPNGVVKQVDWKAWGAKVSFDYKVVRGNEIISQQSFFSNFQPWQAVFLRGTRE